MSFTFRQRRRLRVGSPALAERRIEAHAAVDEVALVGGALKTSTKVAPHGIAESGGGEAADDSVKPGLVAAEFLAHAHG
jgi:hypothetical protein